MRLAFVTAGTVGAGHLVHGLAIERGLLRAGFDGSYRMFGPRLPFAAVRSDAYEAVEIYGDTTLRDRRAAPESGLAQALASYAPDLVLVDMFWAPLLYVLPALRCEAWLLVRIAPPIWLEGRPGMSFDPSLYRRILAIEPIRHPAVTDHIDPIVIVNSAACRPATALRERYGIPPHEPLTVVTHAGQPGEVEDLKRIAGEGALVFDLFAPEAPFPAAEWLPSADRIVSGAGYNSFWEARWLGYDERTSFIPFARSIDDQSLRLTAFRTHPMRANGADSLAHLILH